ncbi:MAG: hypothetical protein AAF702_43230 [Chloroflexota bacterium]
MRKISMVIAAIGVTSILLIGGIAYNTLEVHGLVIFEEGTTFAQSLEIMQKYDATLVQYSVTSPYPGGMGSLGFFDEEIDTETLINSHWSDYGATIADYPNIIAQFHEFHRTDTDTARAQIQEMLDEAARFESNEDGCWNRGDCPDVEVSEFEVFATMAVLQTMESDALFVEVDWAAKHWRKLSYYWLHRLFDNDSYIENLH